MATQSLHSYMLSSGLPCPADANRATSLWWGVVGQRSRPPCQWRRLATGSVVGQGLIAVDWKRVTVTSSSSMEEAETPQDVPARTLTAFSKCAANQPPAVQLSRQSASSPGTRLKAYSRLRSHWQCQAPAGATGARWPTPSQAQAGACQ